MNLPAAPIVLGFEVRLPTPAARVFQALTGGPHLARWFCDGCSSEPRAGGRLVMRWTGATTSPQPFEAVWTVFRAPEACAYRGGHSGYPDGDAGEVAFSLAPVDSGTLLSVRHTLPDRAEYRPIAERYRAAWPRALERLARYLTAAA